MELILANCPDGLLAEVLQCLGPISSLELRCISLCFCKTLNHSLLRLSVSSEEEHLERMSRHHLDDLVRGTELSLHAKVSAVLLARTAKPSHGSSVSDSRQHTALIWAATHGLAPLVALLVESGAPLEAMDSTGWTALFTACWHGHQTVARILLRSQADANIQQARYTPLMAAARFGRESIVAELLVARADASVATTFGETAASLARDQGHREIARVLSCSGQDEDPAMQADDCRIGLMPRRVTRHSLGMWGRKKARADFEAALRGQL
jgi:hypothetical protein